MPKNTSPTQATVEERELVLTRHIPAAPEKLFRAWTEPALIVQWFTPPPWTTVRAEVDLRPGGASTVVMRSAEGEEFPSQGVYLEVVPGRRLVFTDAYVRAWEPAQKAFMTVLLDFAPEGTGTRYTARVRHWSVEDRQQHEQMGFEKGWGIATDQLAALAARI